VTDLATSLPPGLLQDVHATGLLSWGDVHVAQKLSFLYTEADERVQLALALTVRALRAGMVCLDLASVTAEAFETDEATITVPEQLWPEPAGWRAAIGASPLVADGAAAAPDRPLRLVGRIKWMIDPAWRNVGLGSLLVNHFVATARSPKTRLWLRPPIRCRPFRLRRVSPTRTRPGRRASVPSM